MVIALYRSSDFKKSAYKTGEVAEILNLSTKSIQSYDKQGKLKVCRSSTNRRMILRDDLLNFLDNQGLLYRDDMNTRVDVIYARVSSHEQKQKGDLDRQALYLMESVSDLVNPVVLKEVGSGLNDKRPLLLKLINMVVNNEVNRVFITYRDRLTRFGYNYLEEVFRHFGVSIIVVKDLSVSKSVQEELVEDMMSLIASFSGKLYGMRSRDTRKAKNKE